MLSWAPSHTYWRYNIKPGHVPGHLLDLYRRPRHPSRLNVEAAVEPEDTHKDRAKPDRQGGPEIVPRVTFSTEVPEAEAEVGDIESDMEEVESFVESLADVGDGEES